MSLYPEENKQPQLITEFDEVDWITFESIEGDEENFTNQENDHE